MKNLLCIIFGFLSLTVSAQFEWIAMAAHNSEKIQVICAAENERIVGWAERESALYVSEDLGENWKKIYRGNLFSSIYDRYAQHNWNFYRPVVKGSVNGYFYILADDNIYRIDESSQSLELIISSDNFSIPKDFICLANGNFAVVDEDHIFLFDTDGNKLEEYVVGGEYRTAVTMHKGPGDRHAAIIDYDIVIVFNSDLDQIIRSHHGDLADQDKVAIDDDGNLYTNRRYSYDGVNWTEYGSIGKGGIPYLTNDGKLIKLGGSCYGISEDQGQTFRRECEFQLSSNTEFAFPVGADGLMISVAPHYSDEDCPYRFYEFSDSFSFLRDVSYRLEVGLPHAEEVEVISDEQLVIFACDSFYNIASGSSLSTIINPSDTLYMCRRPRSFVLLSDTTLISSVGCSTMDYGASWNANLDWANGHVEYNESGLYLLGHETYRTTDSGLSWESLKISYPNGSDYDPHHTLMVSSASTLYIHDQYSDKAFYLLRFPDGVQLGRIEMDIQSAELRDEKVSSFFRPIVYFIIDIPGGDPRLVYYNEITKEFYDNAFPETEEDLRKIKTDHAENVYLYNEKELWLSRNDGETWLNITPDHPDLIELRDIDLGMDGYLYLASYGTPILRTDLNCSDLTFIDSISICEGSTYFWEATNTEYSTGGTYVTNLISELGCDSILSIDLTVLEELHPDCVPSAIEENKVASDISLFPNPAQEIIHILGIADQSISYQIHDVQGRLLMDNKTKHPKTINISTLEAGVYFCSVRKGDELIVLRFLKI